MKKTTYRIFLAAAILLLVSAGCITKKGSDAAQQATSGDITYSGKEGSSALDLLKQKYNNKVETKVYPGVGEFVQAINGVTPDANHYWALYINSKEFDGAPGSYVSHDSDMIEWKLVEVNRSK